MAAAIARAALAALTLAAAGSRAQAQQAPSADPLPDLGVLAEAAPAQTQGARPPLKLNGVAQDLRTRASPALGAPSASSQRGYLLNLDARGLVGETRPLRLNYSLRAALADGATSGDGLRLYLREGYLTWTPRDTSAFTFGRVNLRNGVAYAFNPTDLLRSRSSVDEISLDPLVRRESRLGAVMASGLLLFDKGAVTAIVAPKLSDPKPLNYRRPTGAGLDLYRTNARTRLLLKASYVLDHNVAPEVLLMADGGQWSAGLNLSTGLGESLVAYVEARAGRGDNLLARARAARQTGALPPGPDVLPDGGRQAIYDLAAGVSYSPIAKLNIVLEYDRNGAAPTASQWSRLVDLAARGGLAQAEFRLLNYFAANEEEPRSRDGVFFRVGADSIFVEHLGGSMLATINPKDGSGLVQATAVVDVTAGWTVSLVGAATFGAARSAYGGSAMERSLSVGFARSF